MTLNPAEFLTALSQLASCPTAQGFLHSGHVPALFAISLVPKLIGSFMLLCH
jgi:hypothetical protein